MSRIRTVKPEFFSSPKVARVSKVARLVLIGLLTESDDHGRLLGLERRIVGLLFPHDEDVTIRHVRGWLDELEFEGLIQRYDHGDTDYIWIVGFSEHQHIKDRRVSRIPPPPEKRQTLRQETLLGASARRQLEGRAAPRSLLEPSPPNPSDFLQSPPNVSYTSDFAGFPSNPSGSLQSPPNVSYIDETPEETSGSDTGSEEWDTFGGSRRKKRAGSDPGSDPGSGKLDQGKGEEADETLSLHLVDYAEAENAAEQQTDQPFPETTLRFAGGLSKAVAGVMAEIHQSMNPKRSETIVGQAEAVLVPKTPAALLAEVWGQELKQRFPGFDGVNGRLTFAEIIDSKWKSFRGRVDTHGLADAKRELLRWLSVDYNNGVRRAFETDQRFRPSEVASKPSKPKPSRDALHAECVAIQSRARSQVAGEARDAIEVPPPLTESEGWRLWFERHKLTVVAQAIQRLQA